MEEKNLVEILADRLVFQGKCWRKSALVRCIIGAIICAFGAFLLWRPLPTIGRYSVVFIAVGVFFLFLAFLNVCFSNTYFDYSKEILEKPHKIPEHFANENGCSWNIIYNIFFGGYFGIKGAFFGRDTREFVIENCDSFKKIEKEYIHKIALERLVAKKSQESQE